MRTGRSRKHTFTGYGSKGDGEEAEKSVTTLNTISKSKGRRRTGLDGRRRSVVT